LAASTAARADSVEEFDIPAGELVTALDLLAKQSGVEFVYSTEQLEGLRTQGVHGQFTAASAVAKLLEGTGLSLTVHPGGALLIAPALPTTTPQSHYAQESPDALEEIVVTASKRSEAISKVGGAVSAVSGEKLEERSADSLQDYVAFIPGVTLQSFGTSGYGVVSIRGIAAQSVGATTATYVDEVPFGPSSALSEGALFTLDLDPNDLERVEVLKGPQGTLYGASSMGGLIKYVTRAPDLTKLEANASESFSFTEGGAPGEKVRAAVSLPLIEDELALRVSGYYRHTGGYIDDVGVGGEDTNRSNSRGFRAALLYEPLSDLTIRLNVLGQYTAAHGENVVDYNLANGRPVYGDLTQLRYTSEPFEERIRLYSAEAHYHFGRLDLVSATSYSTLDPATSSDLTTLFAALGRTYASPQAPLSDYSVFPTSKVTQELRLVSARMGLVEWMLGGFYQRESLHSSLALTSYFGPGGLPDTAFDPGAAFRNGMLTEYAGFANATVYLLPQFDLTLGFRDSHISQTRERSGTGLLYNPTDPDAYVVTYQSLAEKSDTYLAAVRWRVTDDVLLYARAASGYRPGGGRSVPPGAPANFPDFYTSDSLWSYETGVKVRELQGRLTVEADAFWIDWNNIQTLQPILGTTVDGNAGSAVSRGIEVQANYVPARGLTLGMNAALTDARFTQSVPLINVTNGERLYFVPKWTAAAVGEYSKPVGAGWSGFVGGDYQYQSLRLDLNRTPLPAYGLWSLHTGVRNDRCRLNIYVNNVTNERALLGYGSGLSGIPYGFVVNTPRTIGVTVFESF
jgi:outer membrane receptor protein involved in Fe transport